MLRLRPASGSSILETPVGATTATSAWRPGTAAEGVTAGVRAADRGGGRSRRGEGRGRPRLGLGREQLVQVGPEIRLRRRRFERDENAVDLALHLAGREEAIPGIARQGLEDQRIDLQRKAGIEVSRRLNPPLTHGVEDRHLALAGEQPSAGQHLEQQRAEREDVRCAHRPAVPRPARETCTGACP